MIISILSSNKTLNIVAKRLNNLKIWRGIYYLNRELISFS